MNGCWPSFQPISNVADMEIEGSVVVVTGAGSGIGWALAQSFAAAGARVVVSDIDAASADGTAASIAAVGHTAVEAVGLLEVALVAVRRGKHQQSGCGRELNACPGGGEDRRLAARPPRHRHPTRRYGG